MINLYLKAMQTVFAVVAVIGILFGSMMADGELFQQAATLMWVGTVALGGVYVCQVLKKLR